MVAPHMSTPAQNGMSNKMLYAKAVPKTAQRINNVNIETYKILHYLIIYLTYKPDIVERISSQP
jgi:hypothetical protein